MNLKERERKVDVSKMNIQAVDDLSMQIGNKIREITDEAAAKVNAILGIYGMSAKIAIAFDTLPKTEEKTPTPQAKKGRKPKKQS